MKLLQILGFLLVCCIGINSVANDLERIEQLKRFVTLRPQDEQLMREMANSDHRLHKLFTLSPEAERYDLYDAFPGLKKTLPRVVLCNLPTPVHALPILSQLLGIDCVVKLDSDTALAAEDEQWFGGNKLRKAELLFADAILNTSQRTEGELDTVISFGCTGSNHALCMAACAKRLGFNCMLMLKPQPNSRVVRRNLSLMHYYGAQLRYYPSHAVRSEGVVYEFMRHKLDKGFYPYIIPTGGSTPLGAVGYVNAAFELKNQIAQGVAVQPDVIYIPTGSCGTLAGLALGLKVAGVPSKVVGVCTEPEDPVAFSGKLFDLIAQTNALLHEKDPAFPLVSITSADIEIVYDCAGQEYGVFTQEAAEAITMMKETENIQLDGTYTGKAFSALVRDARAGKLAGKKVMFWNTFCGCDFSNELADADYKKLPHALHTYFEGELQPLDR